MWNGPTSALRGNFALCVHREEGWEAGETQQERGETETTHQHTKDTPHKPKGPPDQDRRRRKTHRIVYH